MSETITSPHNPRVRALVAMRDRRGRESAGRMLIEGGREVLRALHAGVRIETVYVADHGCRTAECDGARTLAGERGVEIVPLGERAFERAAFGDRNEGILAVGVLPSTTLADLEARLPDEPLLLVLDGLEKPGNIGAVLRSADGAGVDGLIVTGNGSDPYSPNAIRASLGTIFHVPLAVAEADDAVAWLRARGIRIVAARVDGALPYTKTDLRGAVAIALGSEADGLSAAFAGPDVIGVQVPMRGVADSLNVSVAAAVLAYEARRQRG